jgi:hypothetical protein
MASRLALFSPAGISWRFIFGTRTLFVARSRQTSKSCLYYHSLLAQDKVAMAATAMNSRGALPSRLESVRKHQAGFTKFSEHEAD